jgi:hypothetical protein
VAISESLRGMAELNKQNHQARPVEAPPTRYFGRQSDSLGENAIPPCRRGI